MINYDPARSEKDVKVLTLRVRLEVRQSVAGRDLADVGAVLSAVVFVVDVEGSVGVARGRVGPNDVD